jgi:hypothetical protein
MCVPIESQKKQTTHLLYGLLGPVEIHLILLEEGLEAELQEYLWIDAFNSGCKPYCTVCSK